MSSFFATGSDAERVADYRKRADEMFAQAAAAPDTVVRSTLIDIANAYLKLGQQVENQALARVMDAAPAGDLNKPKRPKAPRAKFSAPS